MKNWIFCFITLILANPLLAQRATDGRWQYSFYPNNIVKLTWTGAHEKHTEQISDAVIAEPVIPKKRKATGARVKGYENTITVNTGNATVHFLYGFDSGHHRGVTLLLQQDEHLFGGGERALPLDRRGQRITLYNNPWYGYSEGADQLNYSVPILLSTKGYGLLFDNPSKGYFDVGKTRPEILEAGFESGQLDVYVIPGNNLDEILKNYTTLTGRQPLPPRWALGNFISRFGYRSQQQAENVVSRMKADSFPIDAIIFDLFWFGDSIKGTLGNLDWNAAKWPNPKKMISDFKQENINTILITEPFVLEGTKAFASSQPYLATDSSGKPYSLKDFYFGKGGLVDLFKPASQQWFWQYYKKQKEIGVAGWWGDLGEPEKHPTDLYHNVSSFGVNRLMNANDVHNMYGHQWSKMLSENYTREYPEERLFYLNRAGFAGSQRFSVFPWTGDVSRSWSGLRAQLPNLQSMSLSGIPYIHSDAGGFGGGDSTDSELYTRWLQFACFTPIFRPHGTALGDLDPGVKDIPSEPTFQPEPYKSIVRNVIRTRYQLLPYNYSLSYEQTAFGKPLIRPLFYYDIRDTNLLKAGDQYMWGDAFLIAPVIQQHATDRKLYLPTGSWFNFYNNSVQHGAQWLVEKVDINHIPVYVKAGSFVPVWNETGYTSTANYSSAAPISIRYYPAETPTSYTFYDDDGSSRQSIKNKQYQEVLLKGKSNANSISVSIDAKNWPKGMKRNITIEIPIKDNAIIPFGKSIQYATINGKSVAVNKTSVQWQTVEILFEGKPVRLEIGF